MKQDPSFKLVAIVILAGVVTAFVAPELDSHSAPEAHSAATAE
jgi:FlaG/FlaF family flagellin (archaellin)